jgi:hypothetical protein
MSKLGALLVAIAIALAGCSVVQGSADSRSAAPDGSEEASSQLTDEQILELISSLPEDKSPDGLKSHFLSIDEAASHLKPFTIRYTKGPTAVQSKVDTVIAQYSEKLKMYQFLGLESLNQDWVLASEKDYQWWVDHRSAQEPSFPLSTWNEQSNELGHCRLSAEAFCGAGNTVGGKNYQDNVVGTAFTNRGIDYVSRHEATHFYQAVFGYGARCWMAEGQATFFETYLESSSRSRAEVLLRLNQSPTGFAQLSEPELLGMLARDEICQGDPNLAYDLGMLGYEFLYMNFSFLDVHNLHVLSTTAGWEQAVSEALGQDAAELDRQLAAYITKNLF